MERSARDPARCRLHPAARAYRKRDRLALNKLSSPARRQVWRLVDGAVGKTFLEHPEYIPKGVDEKRVRNSMTKRIVGGIMSYVEGTSSRGRTDPR